MAKKAKKAATQAENTGSLVEEPKSLGPQCSVREIMRAVFFMAQPNTVVAPLIPAAFDTFSGVLSGESLVIGNSPPAGDWSDPLDLVTMRQVVNRRISKSANDANCFLDIVTHGEDGEPEWSFEYHGYSLDDPFSELYSAIDTLFPKLDKSDYEVDEKRRMVALTEAGMEKIEMLLRDAGEFNGDSLYDFENVSIVHHINEALRAHTLYPFTRERAASFAMVTLPLSAFYAHQVKFQQMFMRLLAHLPIFAAYASLSFDGYRPDLQKLVKRYRGVDISSLGSITKDIGQRAPGAFWLNAYKGELRDAFLAQIRGKERPAEVHMATVNGDIELIMLDMEPNRLDRNEKNPESAYRWLARNLQECGRLHVPEKVSYFDDEDDMDDREAQRAWHRRFVEGNGR